MTQKFKNGLISKTIFWYIFRETLFAFAVSFGFFFFIFFVNQLLLMAQEILSKKVPLNQVARLVLFALPSIVSLSAPFATLLGSLMTIGRLSSDNEILVMLASGLSYKNIFLPTAAVGVVVSIFSFIANDVLLPAGTIQFNRLYRSILVSTPALEIESNSVKKFKDTIVITGNVSEKNISDLLILDKTAEGERRVILAKEAEFSDAGEEGIRLDMEKAFIHSSKETERADYDYSSSVFLRYRIAQEDLIQQVQAASPREMTSRDVYKGIKKKRETVNKELKSRIALTFEASSILETTLKKGPANYYWRQRNNLLTVYSREKELTLNARKDRVLSLYLLEFYKKFSLPFGSMAFIFLAVPLGLFAKKNGQAVGFILGLIISLIYWTLLLSGQNVGMRLGYSPFWSIWFPNILCSGLGLVLCLHRVRK
ncbi:MAG: LptF/LptG family permease [Spirochaetaceae bacterium]|jgi:lipopolysaccharide export system permease protein|nr:LptF/LptG family permease [Spirochaetaceae bacterium]